MGRRRKNTPVYSPVGTFHDLASTFCIFFDEMLEGILQRSLQQSLERAFPDFYSYLPSDYCQTLASDVMSKFGGKTWVGKQWETKFLENCSDQCLTEDLSAEKIVQFFRDEYVSEDLCKQLLRDMDRLCKSWLPNSICMELIGTVYGLNEKDLRREQVEMFSSFKQLVEKNIWTYIFEPGWLDPLKDKLVKVNGFRY